MTFSGSHFICIDSPWQFRLRRSCQSETIEFRIRIKITTTQKYIGCEYSSMPKFNGRWTEMLLKLRHGWGIASHIYMAPVPLSIFRSNSKFDENSERSSFKYIRPITTIFCTRHDSDTVVTCAKYRCDRPRIFYTRVFWIFIEFRIRSKYA